MTRAVVCPVALHPDGAPLRIPVFEHPLVGLQLVKGGLRENERFEAGAARELFEESGLETRSALYLGASEHIQENTIWHFSLCRLAPPVRDAWQHFCKNDGGNLFKFKWLEVNDAGQLTPPYSDALDWMRATL